MMPGRLCQEGGQRAEIEIEVGRRKWQTAGKLVHTRMSKLKSGQIETLFQEYFPVSGGGKKRHHGT